MSGTTDQIVMSVAMNVDDGVPIDLRGGLEGQAVLVIGAGIEVFMRESHVRTLRHQATEALGDLTLVESAEEAVDAAYHAGAQARTAAAMAENKAEAARQAGAHDEATAAFDAARRAAEAAEQAQTAARAATDAMDVADSAAVTARAAAITAALAAGHEPPEDSSGQAPHLV